MRAAAAFIALLIGASAIVAMPETAEAQKRTAKKPEPKQDTADTSKPAPEVPDEINFGIGDTKTISARNVKNYSEAIRGLFEVKVTPDQASFVLQGLKAGSTTLLLIYNDGTQKTVSVNVWARSPAIVEKEVTQLLEGIQGVRVRRVAAKFVIDGQVANEGELKRVEKVAVLYPDLVTSIVAAATGAVFTPADEQRYIVRIDVYFVQFDKNASYAVGLGWPKSLATTASINYNLLAGAPSAATASLANFPLPRLDLAARHGWAKILKQTTVVTNNGVEAQFQNGGEQLFSVTQGLATTIQRVNFGADLTVLPRYRPEKNDLDIKVVADVSELTAPAAGTSLPSRVTSKLTTNVSLKLGQALVLSGFRTRTITHTVADGLPILSELPLIGLLFASHNNEEIESQGSIFVVPSVVATVPVPAAELVDSAVGAFRKFGGDFADVGRITPDGPAAAGSESKKQ